MLYCDPPSGWRYGFPKPVPIEMQNASREVFHEWLVKNGYPQKEIDSLGEHFYIRYWEESDDV